MGLNISVFRSLTLISIYGYLCVVHRDYLYELSIIAFVVIKPDMNEAVPDINPEIERAETLNNEDVVLEPEMKQAVPAVPDPKREEAALYQNIWVSVKVIFITVYNAHGFLLKFLLTILLGLVFKSVSGKVNDAIFSVQLYPNYIICDVMMLNLPMCDQKSKVFMQVYDTLIAFHETLPTNDNLELADKHLQDVRVFLARHDIAGHDKHLVSIQRQIVQLKTVSRTCHNNLSFALKFPPNRPSKANIFSI